MKILLDQNISRKLRPLLPGHMVFAAKSVGLDRMPDGDMIRTAETAGYELLITADKSIHHQQNNATRRIAVLERNTNQWATLKKHSGLIAEAVSRTVPGGFEKVELPNTPGT